MAVVSSPGVKGGRPAARADLCGIRETVARHRPAGRPCGLPLALRREGVMHLLPLAEPVASAAEAGDWRARGCWHGPRKAAPVSQIISVIQ